MATYGRIVSRMVRDEMHDTKDDWLPIEFGTVVCAPGCGYVGPVAQTAGEVRHEVACPVCGNHVLFDAYGAELSKTA